MDLFGTNRSSCLSLKKSSITGVGHEEKLRLRNRIVSIAFSCSAHAPYQYYNIKFQLDNRIARIPEAAVVWSYPLKISMLWSNT